VKHRRVWTVLCVIALLATAGCGSSASVSGSVAYDGAPVQDGAITFLPADGQGPSSGALISGGRYRVDEIAPGEKIVNITGVKAISMPRTSAESQQAAESGKEPERATTIPAEAVGNNAAVSVKPGTQQLDFDLKKP
jgi:hypothetical protein